MITWPVLVVLKRRQHILLLQPLRLHLLIKHEGLVHCWIKMLFWRNLFTWADQIWARLFFPIYFTVNVFTAVSFSVVNGGVITAQNDCWWFIHQTCLQDEAVHKHSTECDVYLLMNCWSIFCLWRKVFISGLCSSSQWDLAKVYFPYPSY